MIRRRIVFVNRFYFPDHGATAQILTDLAQGLVKRGWRVQVVTSRMRYDDPSVHLPKRETIQGVEIVRIITTRFGRKNLLGRLIDYATFYPSAFCKLLGLGGKDAIFVAKTDPPLISVVVGLAARIRGSLLVNWLQDLYPEVAVEMGLKAMGGPLGASLRWARNQSLRQARMNVAIGDRMAERLGGQSALGDRMRVIQNWSDDEMIRPIALADAVLRKEWGLTGKFVIGYSGNLGRAHEVETVLGAARRLRDRNDIVFLMIGGGHQSSRLAERAEREGTLGNFQFRPYQDREILDQSLGVADVHWLSLRPEFEGLIVPSKFYGIAAAGRGVIAVTEVDGEIARLVRTEGCGIVIAPGDAEALAGTIEALAADPARVEALGMAARRLIDREYSRERQIERWHHLFEDIAAHA